MTLIRNGVNVKQDDTGQGWPVTRIETIWNGDIDARRVKWTVPDEKLEEKFFLKQGDILFSHINSPEHIAKTAIYRGSPYPLIHGINLLRLRALDNTINPYWLEIYLKTPFSREYFRSRCKKAVNQASLNQSDINSLPIIVPPISGQDGMALR
nr:restriction endonuclease subunit S [Thiocystis violacea]